jgi:GNAT superfamily N-acetyltransferase
MGIGALAKLGKSIGRELFGFLMRSDLNVAKIAEGAGVTLDTLESAPLEDLSAILDRAARSGAIDPRRANNINIQLAKDAQEVAPELTLKDRIVEKYPNVKLDLFGDASKGYELSRIELPKESRGQGIGTNIMDDLISEADAEGATISLTPDTSFGGSSVSRLNDFYKRFGFVDNKGKNKDFSTRNTMYRVPLKDTE